MTAAETVTAPTPTHPHPRMKRTVVWVSIAAGATLLAALLVAAKNPALEYAGPSWQSGDFVEQAPLDPSNPAYVVWDQPSGASATVVVKNNRPYPVTVSTGTQAPFIEVTLAEFDPNGEAEARAEYLDGLESLQLAPGDQAVVALRVSPRCMDLSAGGSMGTDVVTLDVTTFGITSPAEVQFPATYMAGTTSDHTSKPGCR